MIQKILKPKDKPIIIIDSRENRSSVRSYLEDLGAIIKVMPLKVGDYICSERVCIEKKKQNDFISSIIDGRLFQQAKELKENFDKPIFLIEGYYYQSGMNENAIKAALAAIILNYEIPVIMTRDEEETARTIFWLAKREQLIAKKEIGIRGKKKPKEIRELQVHIISSLPGVSGVLSKRILEKFKTIKKFVNATESEMRKVKGIGKVLAKRLHKILNEEYGGNA